jgi:hypothetical protein
MWLVRNSQVESIIGNTGLGARVFILESPKSGIAMDGARTTKKPEAVSS